MKDINQNRTNHYYRIYPYKRPLPINRPPPTSQPFTLHSSYFGVLHLFQQPPALRFWDSEKKMRFSISPIEYLLQEIKKITTKHGNFDHRRIKICKNEKFKVYRFIISSDLRFVFKILSSPVIIHAGKRD